MANNGPHADNIANALLESRAWEKTPLAQIRYQVVPIQATSSMSPWELDRAGPMDLQARVVYSHYEEVHRRLTTFIGEVLAGKRNGPPKIKVHEAPAPPREVPVHYMTSYERPKGIWGLFLAAILPRFLQHLVPEEDVLVEVETWVEVEVPATTVTYTEEVWYLDPFISTRHPESARQPFVVVSVNDRLTREGGEMLRAHEEARLDRDFEGYVRQY